MRMIAYVRVSTTGQNERGYGLDAQRATIMAYAEQRGWNLTWVVDGAQSGRDINRPGIIGALADLKAKRYDGLVVAKLDRLSRSMMDFADILQRAAKQEWAVVAIDLGIDVTTPAGEMVAGMMAAVARWERRMISVRIKEAFAVKKARGGHIGGYSRTPVEVAERIHARRAGGHTYTRIANDLNDDLVQLPMGGTVWTAGTIQLIAERPVAEPLLPMLPRTVPVDGPRLAYITGRKLQAAQLIAAGMTNAEAATEMGVSVRTVHGYTVTIRRMLQVHTRQAMIDMVKADLTQPLGPDRPRPATGRYFGQRRLRSAGIPGGPMLQLARFQRVTGVDRDALGVYFRAEYERGRTTSDLAVESGASHGATRRLLSESGVQFRGRGGPGRRL